MKNIVWDPVRKWYGLYEDGELIAIEQFFDQPTIFEFRLSYLNDCDYKMVRVTITPEE